jgi:hypothetical protein
VRLSVSTKGPLLCVLTATTRLFLQWEQQFRFVTLACQMQVCKTGRTGIFESKILSPGDRRIIARRPFQSTTKSACNESRLVKVANGSTDCLGVEMTEYVIKEIGPHQWLVFADRKSIAVCADEIEAVKAMTEHSVRSRRLGNSADCCPEQNPPAT